MIIVRENEHYCFTCLYGISFVNITTDQGSDIILRLCRDCAKFLSDTLPGFLKPTTLLDKKRKKK